MSKSGARSNLRFMPVQDASPAALDTVVVHGETPQTDVPKRPPINDPLLTAEEVAERLNVSRDWVWDHSSRKAPLIPVIRMGDGALRYRTSKIEEFINERERLSNLRRKRG